MKIVLVVLPLVVLAWLLVYLLQGKMIFFPQPIPEISRMYWSDHEITLVRKGRRLQGWYLDGSVSRETPLLIYYGGNADELSSNLNDLGQLKSGATLTLNYPGYGATEGRPSERRILADALFAFDEITTQEGIAPENVVLLGRSLGSGVAVHVASQRPVRGVILVTPFDSLLGVARRHYPSLPVGLVLVHRFDSLALAPSITVPALFLISGRDQLIPPDLSLKLAQAWGGPVQTVIIGQTGHNEIQTDIRYWDSINAFLEGP